MDLQNRCDVLGRMLKHTWQDTLPDKETAVAMDECLADLDLSEKRLNFVVKQLEWYQARVGELIGELTQNLAGNLSDNARKVVEKAKTGLP